jgi:hypothetical protein
MNAIAVSAEPEPPIAQVELGAAPDLHARLQRPARATLAPDAERRRNRPWAWA